MAILKSTLDITERRVRLKGIRDLMFDRYPGDNNTKLPVEAKMYFGKDSRTLVMPSANIHSFLSAKNTGSVSKLIGGRGYKALADAMLSYVQIGPQEVVITREGQPIIFNGFVDGVDKEAGLYVHYSTARLANGVPNEKERPVLSAPWEIEFDLSLFKNSTVSETLLQDAFMKGGLAIGLGTYRGVFGKFMIDKWE